VRSGESYRILGKAVEQVVPQSPFSPGGGVSGLFATHPLMSDPHRAAQSKWHGGLNSAATHQPQFGMSGRQPGQLGVTLGSARIAA
jgi:hypothetical protein